MNELQGTVVWFNNAKGFGFLGHDGGPDVFVHFSSIHADGYKTLKEGDKVRFKIAQGDKGPQAEDVTVLGRGDGAARIDGIAHSDVAATATQSQTEFTQPNQR